MLYSILILICTAITAGGVAAVLAATRRNHASTPNVGLAAAGSDDERSDDEHSEAKGESFGISVLKPLCGVDDALVENLRTFFEQRYSRFELVFAIQGSDDPAIEVVEQLRREYPDVACKLVVHSGGHGINPKVANLRGALGALSYDAVVISDSNVAVERDYLAGIAVALSDSKIGLVTHLIVGEGAQTLGSRLDALHLNGPVAASVAASERLGATIPIGKSLAFRHSQFEALGGFSSVANVLAEDYVMGRMFREAGYEVRLAPGLVRNITRRARVRDFVKRQARWSLLRSRLRPFSYPFEVLGNPIALALAAPLFGVGLAAPLLWAVVLIAWRDGAQWMSLRGQSGLLSALVLGPFKELLMLGVWACAPWTRYVSWRGNKVRLSMGTQLYAVAQR